MPAAKYTGSPGGSGNPPGKYSKGYLGSMDRGGHFVVGGDYRGSMHVGAPTSSKVVGLSSRVEGVDELKASPKGNMDPIHHSGKKGY